MADLNAFKVESAMRMVAGTARSMGMNVTGTPPGQKQQLKPKKLLANEGDLQNLRQRRLTSKNCIVKLTKKRKIAEEKVEKDRLYSVEEASSLIKEVTKVNFDASVDIHVRLGVDPRKADQNLRGTVSLPHGTGKTKRVLVFCTPDKEEEAKLRVLITLDSTSSSKKSAADGQTLT